MIQVHTKYTKCSPAYLWTQRGAFILSAHNHDATSLSMQCCVLVSCNHCIPDGGAWFPPTPCYISCDWADSWWCAHQYATQDCHSLAPGAAGPATPPVLLGDWLQFIIIIMSTALFSLETSFLSRLSHSTNINSANCCLLSLCHFCWHCWIVCYDHTTSSHFEFMKDRDPTSDSSHSTKCHCDRFRSVHLRLALAFIENHNPQRIQFRECRSWFFR